MRNVIPDHPEVAMIDGAFASHIVLWVVGAIAAIGALGTIGAFFSMGRSAYRKD
jgi:hypothetical protein